MRMIVHVLYGLTYITRDTLEKRKKLDFANDFQMQIIFKIFKKSTKI